MNIENIRKVGMLFIALITLVIVSSIILITNINLKADNSKTTLENTDNLTEEEITSLISLMDIYDSYIITFDGDKDINSLTDLEKINFIDRLPYNIKNTLELDFDEGVSLNKIEEILKKYFGPKTTFTPVNSTCFLDDGDYLIYDSKEEIYKSNSEEHSHGAYYPLSIENYYIEGKRIVEQDQLIYIINVKKAFAYSNSSKYYGSYKDLVNDKNMIVNLYEEYGDYDEDDINSLIESFSDSLTSYTYVFQTKDSIDNSYLIELVKEEYSNS